MVKKAKESDKLVKGDVLTFYISDEFFEKGKKMSLPLCASSPSWILFMRMKNPCGQQACGAYRTFRMSTREFNTAHNHIMGYLCANGSYNPDAENSFAPALCNRIDRNTQGLVIAAKNAASLKEMNDIIKNREVEKRYLAAVHGVPKQKEGHHKELLNTRTLRTIW
jgi:23S rRNA pseudouridine955/2504/2580 synthase